MSDDFVEEPVLTEEVEQPAPPGGDVPPLFVQDGDGKLTIDWQGREPDVTRITPEALQMLVDRANSGVPNL